MLLCYSSLPVVFFFFSLFFFFPFLSFPFLFVFFSFLFSFLFFLLLSSFPSKPLYIYISFLRFSHAAFPFPSLFSLSSLLPHLIGFAFLYFSPVSWRFLGSSSILLLKYCSLYSCSSPFFLPMPPLFLSLMDF